MKNENLGSLFLRHTAMSVPWAIVFFVMLCVSAIVVKQEFKEAMQYTARIFVYETLRLSIDDNIATPFKENVKHGIEFATKTAGNEIRSLLGDPAVRANVRALMEKEANP